MEKQWEDYYEIAEKYFNLNGHLLVPEDYVYDGFELGKWVNEQRLLISKKTKKSITYIDLLNKIGMVWELKEYTWDEMFDMLRKYNEKYGNVFISASYTIDNCFLGKWTLEQRNLYRKHRGKLSAENISKLESLGVDAWNTSELNVYWEGSYNLAKEYYENNGDLKIPVNYVSYGVRLGLWIFNQRERFKGVNKSRILTDYEKKKLDDIGMVWEVRKRLTWDESYAYLVSFHETFGHVKVPVNYKTSDGYALGDWLRTQKLIYEGKIKNRSISEDRIQKLLALNVKMPQKTMSQNSIVNMSSSKRWEAMFLLAKSYTRNHNINDIPLDYVCENGEELGIWVKKQKNSFDDLSETKKKKLLRLGLKRTVKRISWDDWFFMAEAYYNECGNLKVPRYFQSKHPDYGDTLFSLGRWIASNRLIYNGKTPGRSLTQAQIDKLNSIGMIWRDVPKANPKTNKEREQEVLKEDEDN